MSVLRIVRIVPMERETNWTLSCLWIRVRLVGGKKKMSASRLDWRSGHRRSYDSLFNKCGGELWPGSHFPGTTAFACFPCIWWDRAVSAMEQERKSW